MKTETGRGADAAPIKGLFQISKRGQDRFQELLYPKAAAPAWRRGVVDAITTAAERSDRWLASRACHLSNQRATVGRSRRLFRLGDASPLSSRR